MKYLLLFSFLIISVISFSQDSTHSNHYCVATVIVSAIPKGVFIAIEQDNGKLTKIKDENKHDKRFTSLTGALDYMYMQGWELVTTYSYENLYNAVCIFKRKEK